MKLYDTARSIERTKKSQKKNFTLSDLKRSTNSEIHLQKLSYQVAFMLLCFLCFKLSYQVAFMLSLSLVFFGGLSIFCIVHQGELVRLDNIKMIQKDDQWLFSKRFSKRSLQTFCDKLTMQCLFVLLCTRARIPFRRAKLTLTHFPCLVLKKIPFFGSLDFLLYTFLVLS